MVVQSIVGLILFNVFAFLISEHRRKVKVQRALFGIGLQLAIAVVLLKVPLTRGLFLSLNRVILSLEESTEAGTSVVFGFLGGGPLPFEESLPGASYILAFRALPLVLLISALSALLFHWNILPQIVRGFSALLQRTLRIGGAEGLSVAANIFMGMVESPLFVRPYLKLLTRSELFTVMSCGMATIAGTVMVLYASMLSNLVPNILGHILIASIISAPAAIRGSA